MIRKFFLYLVISLISTYSFGQQVTNLVLVGPNNEVTTDAKEATSFIVIKQYPDSHFERLDYKKGGPLVQLRSYSDQDLKILNGRYFEYAPNGALNILGDYLNNEKNGSWMTYNDTGKVINQIRYAHDSIVEIVDLDKKDSSITYGDEREASFTGGTKAWVKYLLKKLEKDNAITQAFHGGTVWINFAISTDGSIQDVFISKSVEFILDESSLQIIGAGPKWNPAFQNGKNLKAYRRQPLTFVKD